MTRRGLLRAFAATTIVAAPVSGNAFGILRGAGDIRRIRMTSGRTGESIDTIYWIEGKYIPEALEEVSFFMRDWRNNKTKVIDHRTVDIMAASQRLLDSTEPYTLFSGYRSPETNAMLRRRSRGVAKNSRHLKGEAADLWQYVLQAVKEQQQKLGIGRYRSADGYAEPTAPRIDVQRDGVGGAKPRRADVHRLAGRRSFQTHQRSIRPLYR